MKEQQYYLFYEPKEDKLQRQVEELSEQLNNVRRGLFKRHQELSKMYLEMQNELEILKWKKDVEISQNQLLL